MKDLVYEQWKHGNLAAGAQWGIPELWWHDSAEVRSVNCDIEIDSPSAQTFSLTGRLLKSKENGEFILRFWWDNEIEAGYCYQLKMRFGSHENLPDIVLYDGGVIWDKKTDYDVSDGNSPCFYLYAEKSGIPCFDMIVKLDKLRPEFTLLPPHQGDYEGINMTMPRAKGAPGVYSPVYEYPENAVVQRCDVRKSARLLHRTYFYDENPVIAPLPAGASVSDVKIYEHTLYPTRGNAHLLKDLAMDGIVYMAVAYDETADFACFAQASIDQGLKTLVLFPVVSKKLFNEVCGENEYAFCYINDLLTGQNCFLNIEAGTFPDSDAFVDTGVESTVKCARYWLDRCPDGKVMFLYPEITNSLGAYTGGISTSSISALQNYKDVLKGGSVAFEAAFSFFADLRRRFEEKLEDYGGRYSFFCHPDYGAYNQAVTQSLSVDGCFGKNGNRGCGNIVTANTRGNAHSFGHQYGLVFDAWDRLYWWNHCYDGILTGLLSFFFSGCKMFTNEIYVEDRETGNITKWGEAWFDFVRFSKVHPALGAPVVKTGVMRGLGDEWQRCAGDTSSWEAEANVISAEMPRQLLEFAPTTKWRKAFNAYRKNKYVTADDTYFNDYNLLNVPFAQFGHVMRTDSEKAFTGTPYGALDFVAWNAPIDVLRDYELLVYMGRGVGTSLEQIKELEQYVAQGGTLIMAAGQLRSEKDLFSVDTFCGISIGQTHKLDDNLYTGLAGGTVTKTLFNNMPYTVENSFGKGQVILFSGEYLTDYSLDEAKEIFRNNLNSIKLIEFDKDASHIEYCFTRYKNGYLLPLINHGRGAFPSGNGTDYGTYKGSITVDLDKLGLQGCVTVMQLNMPLDGTSLPDFTPYPFTQSGNKISFDADVDVLQEFVILPSREFFL